MKPRINLEKRAGNGTAPKLSANGEEAIIADASVVVKWFIEEEHRDKAVEIRNKFVNGDIQIITPDLILYELANALRYNPSFNVSDVCEAIESIYELGILILEPQPEIFGFAINISFSKNISFYDAYYVALSQYSKFNFVTADKKLYEKINDLTEVILLSNLTP